MRFLETGLLFLLKKKQTSEVLVPELVVVATEVSAVVQEWALWHLFLR